MRLTRRDAVAALAAAGVAAGATTLEAPTAVDDPSVEGLDDGGLAVLHAVAGVVYPAPVESVRPFVTRYVAGRAADRPAWAAGVADAAAYLDAYARSWRDDAFAALTAADRDALLRSMGVDAASPDPDGDPASRVRYYLVNDLLFALYSSPTGGRLVGLENPQGHPGGTRSYQRGPDR